MSFSKRFMAFVRRPEGFFLTATIVFGGIFLLLFPPLQTPDEASHFMRAYQVSQFELAPMAHGGLIGGELPKSLSATIKLLDTNPSLRFHPETKYDLHRTAAALHIPLDKNDRTFTSGVTSYSPVGYIPQAIGIFIGTLFNLPPVVLMYIARVMSLVTWAFLIFMSIKLVPYKKWAFVGFGLLPMFIAQAVSPGIDAISIGLGVLFLASVLHLREKPTIRLKWWLVLLLMACLIALTKQTTILILGFVFLLKSSQFEALSWKGVAKKLLIIILPVFIFIGWTLITSHLNLAGTTQIEGQNSSGQVSNIVHNPLRFPQVLFNTFFTTWGDSVDQSFIGDFGWADTPLAGGLVNLGYIFIALLLFANYDTVRTKLTRVNKWLIILLVAAYVLGTCAALYVFYSPVNFNIVYGLQGRYFLLALFMLIPIFATSQLKLSKTKYTRLVQIGASLLLLASALTIYLRYYITLF